MNEDPCMDSQNHGLAAKLETDLLLLRSLRKLFPYRKFTFSLSAGIKALGLMFFLMNFMNDGIVLCLSHLFASLKWRVWSLK